MTSERFKVTLVELVFRFFTMVAQLAHHAYDIVPYSALEFSVVNVLVQLSPFVKRMVSVLSYLVVGAVGDLSEAEAGERARV